MSRNSNNPYTHVETFGYNTNYMGLETTQPSAIFHATGSAIIGTNLIVNGVLQSPLTSLIGVSVSIVNNSVGGFSSKLAIDKAHSGYVNIELRSNQSGAGSLSLSPKTDNMENSVYFNPSAVCSSYIPGTTGT